MQTNAKIKILLIGDFESAPFQAAVSRFASAGQLRCEKQVAAAEAACLEDPPDLIVFAQLRPGQFSADQVEQLHQAAPLARVMALLGSWCEGETRTGSPWPGVKRVYWHEFSEEATRELLSGRAPWPRLPRTSSEVERLLSEPRVVDPRQGLIVVRTDDQLSFEVLADLLVDAGYAASRVCRNERFSVRGAVAGIWDCSLSVFEDREPLQRFADQLHPVPVIALVGFPRTADCQLAAECGACSVIGKPLSAKELIRALPSLAPPNLTRLREARRLRETA